jgi:hypothetical protein
MAYLFDEQRETIATSLTNLAELAEADARGVPLDGSS